jgi:serine-type D-Ala-D-Ala carboxypeptidase (penicillin-binding protein 5/6)
VPARRVVRILRRGERPVTSVRAEEELEGPLPRGTRAGVLTVRLRGRVVDRVPLVTAQPVPKVGLVERAVDFALQPGTLAIAFIVLTGGTLVAIVVRRRRRVPAQ